MKCPVCPDSTLLISSREGIEIDHCPDCRGVWLDRGELDKIIDRSSPAVASEPRGRSDVRPPDRYDDDRYRREERYRDDDHYRYDPRRKRKKSFLDDLFDFD